MRQSPLDAEHRALDARMVPFGGWEMPIQYAGVLEEHRACRDHAVVFDVSHLGSVRVQGPGAHAALQWAFTNDLGRIAPGRAQYTHLLDPDDASVVDDIIVWWVAEDEFLVMPNASNTDRLVEALRSGPETSERAAGPDDLAVEDITEQRVVLAVQGPKARALLSTVHTDAASVGRFRVSRATFGDGGGVEGWAAGTGYTGEDGVELHVPLDAATDVWRAILAAGVTPAGLGARDTLRLEAGLPLHGHELGPGITPLQADLAWVVRFDKGEFRGRDALLAERDAGVTRRLRRLLVDGRRIARAGAAVSIGDVVVGEVTSGNFSPVLERGIALAFLPPDVADDTKVSLDVRGRAVAATVLGSPFLPAGS